MNHKQTRLGQTPALMVYRNKLSEAAQKGCILFFHGLTGAKEVQLPELESLAEHGFLAVGLDNVGHGERRFPDFETLFSDRNPNIEQEFLSAVLSTAQEVSEILNVLENEGLIHPQKIGAAGISMGGYIIYTAVTLEPRIKVAASIIGSPLWKLDLPESPHRHLDKFSNVKLLSQTAGKDDIVPARYARQFHTRLKTYYADYDDRFAYIEYPRSGHFMETEDWETVWTKTVNWFESHFG